MLSMDVIKVALTEWVPPIVPFPKKDRTFRPFDNYHNLSVVTIFHLYLILHMGECIDSLSKAPVF